MIENQTFNEIDAIILNLNINLLNDILNDYIHNTIIKENPHLELKGINYVSIVSTLECEDSTKSFENPHLSFSSPKVKELYEGAVQCLDAHNIIDMTINALHHYLKLNDYSKNTLDVFRSKDALGSYSNYSIRLPKKYLIPLMHYSNNLLSLLKKNTLVKLDINFDIFDRAVNETTVNALDSYFNANERLIIMSLSVFLDIFNKDILKMYAKALTENINETTKRISLIKEELRSEPTDASTIELQIAEYHLSNLSQTLKSVDIKISLLSNKSNLAN